MSKLLPKITKKEQEIVRLLYSFRFLNRKQIQALLSHKDYKTINMWLRDLREKQYIGWIYSTHYAERTKPAVYYLSLNGIRYLRQFTRPDTYFDEDVPFYPPEELRKRYKDPKRSQAFIDYSDLVAACCVTLTQNNASTSRHSFQTEADYILETNNFNFILDREIICPSLCVRSYTCGGASNSEKTIKSYLLQVFDDNQTRLAIRWHIQNYIKFMNEQLYDWMDEIDSQKPPEIRFVIPRLGDLIYAKRKLRQLVAEDREYGYDDDPRPIIKLTTVDKLKAADFLKEEIWEKV